IGLIVLSRTSVRPFTDKQIELVNSFADQAVIAIENTRLFEELHARTRELTEALKYQSATSEVLDVISRSSFDLQRVFHTLAESAVTLCEAEHAFIFRFDGHVLYAVAMHNSPSALEAYVEVNPMSPGRGSAAARVAVERKTIQIEDIQSDPDF